MRSTGQKAAVWAVGALIGAAWLFAGVGPASADRGGYGGHHKRPDAGDFVRHVMMQKDALNLSDEQVNKLHAIGVDFKKEDIKKRADVELAELEMHQLLHRQDQSAGSADIESAVRKLYNLKADARIASIKAFQEAKAVLTPEQQKRMRELHRGHGGHGDRGGMDGRHHGGPAGDRYEREGGR